MIKTLILLIISSKLFLIAELCFAVGVMWLYGDASLISEELLIELVTVGSLALYIVVNKKMGILAKVVGTYCLVSFCIFPLLEMLTNTVYWGGGNLTLTDFSRANLVVIVSMISFIVGYRIKVTSSSLFSIIKFDTRLTQLQYQLIISSSGCIFFGVLYLYGWDITTLFFRGGVLHKDLNVDSKMSLLMVEFFCRPLIFNIGLFVFLTSFRQRTTGSLIAIFLGFIALFPTGIPRFLAVAMYLPFILIWYYSYLKERKFLIRKTGLFLPNILLLGLVIAMPLLDLFRWYSEITTDFFNVINIDTLLAGHFDGYQMLTRALAIGEINYGYGFFGALFFFVPRSIWESKPIGSAQVISHQAWLNFDNVSMPFVGELYLNFWYFGVFFGEILFGFFVKIIDDHFNKRLQHEISVSRIFYFQSIGLLLLILRGSFLSAFAYFSAIALSWAAIYMICKIGRLNPN